MDKYENEVRQALLWLVDIAIDKGYFDDFQSDFMEEHENDFEQDDDGYFTNEAYDKFWKIINTYKNKFLAED